MIKINDYATKNHLNEWEIKDLPDSEVYRLDLQDFSIIFALPKFDKPIKLFIPTPTKHIIAFSLRAIFASIYHDVNHGIQIFFIDVNNVNNVNNVNTMSQYKNITPEWSKYIAKDNAVLFLSGEDKNRYITTKEKIKSLLWNQLQKAKQEFDLSAFIVLQNNIRKISIILPSIHSKNIQEISNIAKDLKENYGVEYVEVVATHCFIRNFWDEVKILKTKEEIRNEAIKKVKNNLNCNLATDIINGDKSDFISAVRQSNKSAEEIFDLIAKAQPEVLERHIVDKIEQIDKFKTVKDIDRLITTDSTGVLKVQDTDKLKVVDCEEFFINFLQNDKS